MNVTDLYMEFTTKRKSGRTWIITPDGSDPVFEKVKADNTLLKAMLKGNSWQRKIRRGAYDSIADLSKHMSITESYVYRIMNINYISPKIKEMILDGKQPKHLNLQDIIYDVPLSWIEQEKKWLV
jgi:hypothetical protein